MYVDYLQADVMLTFPDAPPTKEKQDQYAKKPEIKVCYLHGYNLD